MPSKKIMSGIVLLLVIVIGGIFWLKIKRAHAPNDQQLVAQQTTSDRTELQLQPKNSQQPREADSITQIQVLSTKWAKFGLTQWEEKELLSSGIVGIFPIDSKVFKITTTKDSGLHDTELGSLIGQISVPHVSDDKLFGDSQISTNQIADRDTLESWINKKGVTIHQNYCKKYGVDDMRYPGNKTCITKISISKKVSDNVILWNTNFIGSPDILSVLVGKTIISFELSQFISEEKVNFKDFIQDIALTLK